MAHGPSPEWKTLRAVRDDQIYLADGNQYLNRPGPRVVESMQILGEILYPERFDPALERLGWEKLSSATLLRRTTGRSRFADSEKRRFRAATVRKRMLSPSTKSMQILGEILYPERLWEKRRFRAATLRKRVHRS